MAEKTWLDYGAFVDAYRMAVQQHAQTSEVNSERLEKSVSVGKTISDRTQKGKSG